MDRQKANKSGCSMWHICGVTSTVYGVPFLFAEYYSASTWNQATETLDALEVNEPCLVSRSMGPWWPVDHSQSWWFQNLVLFWYSDDSDVVCKAKSGHNWAQWTTSQASPLTVAGWKWLEFSVGMCWEILSIGPWHRKSRHQQKQTLQV